MIIPVSQIATRFAWTLAFTLWVPSAAHSETQLPTAPDPSGAWFRPSLDVNEDPELCSALLETGIRDFFAMSRSRTEVDDWSPLLRPVPMTPSQGPLRPLADGEDPRTLVRAGPLPTDASMSFAEIDGHRVYLAKTRQGGCGGTCESASFHASARPWGFIENPRAEEAYARLGATTVTVPEYMYEWLRAEDGRLFVGYRQRDDADGREQLVLVKLTQDGSWRDTCRVRMHPGNLAAVDNAALRRALASVRALDTAAGRLSGEGGNCGTMRALGQLNQHRMQALEESLYMPWTFLAGGVPATDRAATPADLDRWAELGVFERDALADYRKQRAETLDVLSKYYAEQFGWSRGESRSVARTVLANAADRAFTFPESTAAYGDRGSALALRAAILDREPLERIRAMPVSVEAINGDDDQHKESLLNSAIEYPEALAYLLERGANPDRPNAFGKTPLMYAAQHNALASARLLLDHGANPNLATVQPRDTCYYQLETTSVTALHYAIRYASADLVELLLDRGAAIFAQSHGSPYGGDHRPLDWLRRYTAVDAEEPNRNIHAREVRALTARLTLPDARVLESWSLELTIRAEAEYAAGEAAKAYETLRLALQASPNQRALSDMSLIALRAGYPNQAVSSAWLLTKSTDRRLLANAWFNLGLACEAFERRHNDYCPPAPPTSFVRAWLVEPAPARAEKLLATIEKHTSCVETRPEGIYRYVLPDPKRFRNRPPLQFYVTHPRGTDLASRNLQWRPLDRPEASVRIVGRYELGDITITELESPGNIDLPAAGSGFACDSPPRAR